MNHDDDSDLTDLESDDYAASSTQKAAFKSQKDAPAYTIKKTLNAPRATTYAAQALYDEMHNGYINLDAEYQRDVVWPDSKQISLIDSIFRNFYVPPVIFATKSHDDGSETKICIDGKQRLTSIRRFMDGIIPHKDPLTAEKWWYIDSPTPEKKARKVLPERLRRLFAGKQIVCVEYQEITENDEREVFQRVQLGMALTPAEKLQVINTPRTSFVRELQSEHVKDGGLSSAHLEWDSNRGADFRCLAQALWAIDRYSAGLNNVGTIAQLEKWLSVGEEMEISFEQKARDTFRIFSELVLDPKLGKVFKQPAKVSPIEFILISLLIAVHRTKLSMAQLSAAIGGMRREVRREHVDIRMNNRVAKTMIDHIKGLKPTGDSSAPVASQSKGKASTSKEKGKRKRDGDDDDYEDDEDEDDYTEPPVKAKTKKPKSASSKNPPPQSVNVKTEPSSTPVPAPPPLLPSVNAPSSRLAALRATTQGSHPLPPVPSFASQQQFPSSSSTPSTPQLRSPSHNFTFPSSVNAVSGLGGAYTHSTQQSQTQSLPYSYDPNAHDSRRDSYSSQASQGSYGPPPSYSTGSSYPSRDPPLPTRRGSHYDVADDRYRDRERERDNGYQSRRRGSDYRR